MVTLDQMLVQVLVIVFAASTSKVISVAVRERRKLMERLFEFLVMPGSSVGEAVSGSRPMA